LDFNKLALVKEVIIYKRLQEILQEITRKKRISIKHPYLQAHISATLADTYSKAEIRACEANPADLVHSKFLFFPLRQEKIKNTPTLWRTHI